MLKLLFGEIVKELNENPAGKYLVDMLGIKKDVDIKA